MKIVDYKIYKFKIPFNSPLQLKPGPISHREGLIIKLIDEDNFFGLGEISPLPGFNDESLEDSSIQVKVLSEKLKLLEISDLSTYPYSELEEITGRCYPSIQFGIETAVMEIYSRVANLTLSKYLNKNAQNIIYINGLLNGEKKEVLEKASKLKYDGYKAVKLKVGRSKVAEDIALTKEVRKAIGDDIELRLDSNQSWNLDDAKKFCSGAADFNISYLEEPLQNTKELVKSLNEGEFAIPIALDETLSEIFPAELHTFDAVDAIVIKPTLLGLVKSLKFAHQAKAQGISSVISASFESALGLNHLTHIAAAIDEDSTPMGLDTYSMFADDVIQGSLPVKAGCINLDNLSGTEETLNSGLLEEVFAK